MNFLRQGFQKLLSNWQTDGQTDRHTRPKSYTAGGQKRSPTEKLRRLEKQIITARKYQQ